MANEVGVLNLITNESLTGVLPPELAASISLLITILKAAGILFIIYLVFLITTSVMNIIRGKRIKKILEKVHEIDEKLDKLLGKKKK